MTVVAMWCRHAGDDLIGIGDNIPWNVPSDTKHFLDVVSGQTVVCGRITYESFPGRTIDGCKMLVLTSNPEYEVSDLAAHRVISGQKALAEEDALQAQQPDPAVWEYNGVKERHPDDMVLYQMGDFFELYGEDAKTAAAELGFNLTTRAIPGGGRVEMCGFPANRLEQVVEQLRDKHDVTISAVPKGGRERQEYSMPSIDHEAEQHIDAQEAELGADGTRVFRDTEPEQATPTIRELHEKYKPIVMEAVTQDTRYRNACGHSDYENAMIECNAAVRRAILDSHDIELIRLFSDVPEFRQRLHREVADETYPKLHELLRPLSQDDIDDAICAWNGDIQSKHAVVRYMEQHGREKDTAAWLAQEYSGSDSKNLFVIRAGSPEGIELPWPKVQRRIAQLIKEDRFYTEAEQDRFDGELRSLGALGDGESIFVRQPGNGPSSPDGDDGVSDS